MGHDGPPRFQEEVIPAFSDYFTFTDPEHPKWGQQDTIVALFVVVLSSD